MVGEFSLFFFFAKATLWRRLAVDEQAGGSRLYKGKFTNPKQGSAALASLRGTQDNMSRPSRPSAGRASGWCSWSSDREWMAGLSGEATRCSKGGESR